jgi:hypothetical protein
VTQAQHIEDQLAALAKAETAATEDLGRASLAIAMGQKPSVDIADVEAELLGVAAQRRRLEAALVAAKAQATEATEAELQTMLDKALEQAQDDAEQLKQAKALDTALRDAVAAANALAHAGQARRQALATAGQVLRKMVPDAGTATVEGAAALAHLLDGSAVRRSETLVQVNALMQALGLPAETSLIGATDKSTAKLLESDSALLTERLTSWTPAQVRAAFEQREEA